MPVFSAPVITVYVRHHKDCPHRDEHLLQGQGLQLSEAVPLDAQRETGGDVSAKTRSWAEAEKQKQKLLEQFEGATPAPTQVEAESRVTLLEAKERFLRSKRHSEEAGRVSHQKVRPRD